MAALLGLAQLVRNPVMAFDLGMDGTAWAQHWRGSQWAAELAISMRELYHCTTMRLCMGLVIFASRTLGLRHAAVFPRRRHATELFRTIVAGFVPHVEGVEKFWATFSATYLRLLGGFKPDATLYDVIRAMLTDLASRQVLMQLYDAMEMFGSLLVAGGHTAQRTAFLRRCVLRTRSPRNWDSRWIPAVRAAASHSWHSLYRSKPRDRGLFTHTHTKKKEPWPDQGGIGTGVPPADQGPLHRTSDYNTALIAAVAGPLFFFVLSAQRLAAQVFVNHRGPRTHLPQ